MGWLIDTPTPTRADGRTGAGERGKTVETVGAGADRGRVARGAHVDDADAFADSLPGWDPEARAAFLASLDDDEAPELPLLAESVDEMDPAMVEALMQLRDGGEPPSELAVDAKERGNGHYKRAVSTKNKLFYREAAKEYSDGLALCVAARSEADDEEDPQTRLTLHANRAACSLALKNYGECVKDCKAALAIDQHNAKAAYRLARALLGLKKHKQARDAAQWGLASAPDDKALTKTLADAQRGLNQADAVAAKVAAKHASEAATHRAVFDACDVLSVRLGPAPPATGRAYDAWPFLEGGDLRVPVVFAYPEVDDAPPDLLEACAPSDLMADWLLTLFPDDNGPAWDSAGAYRAPLVKCYARLRQVTGFYRGDAYAEYRARREKDGGKFDEDDKGDDAYLEVPAAAAFLDVLSHPHFVLGGPLVVEVRAPSADHDGWRARTKVREMSLVA